MADAIFLKKVREITKKNNIILIFDECTSGFRRYLGGDHMNHGIFPDICILGKALGNGYPITAILGREKIMKKAQDSFISSTFWTERTGYVAALKTISCMNKTKSWKKIINFGRYLNKKWIELSKKYNLEIKIEGYESITSFYFLSKDHLKYKTFITQEMLKKKYLASNLFYLSVLHTKKEIDKYIKNLDPVFKKISMCEKKQLKIDNLLDTRVCSSGFARVN
jgi:glutamate-1-semialdehyde aminotransferase